MKIIDTNRFALQGDNGELITVNVTSMGTAFLVRYRVDGGQVTEAPNEGSMTEGVPLEFKLDKTNGARNNLNLGFTFATPGEVSRTPNEGPIEYDVEVTGNAADSDTSREFIDCSFGV